MVRIFNIFHGRFPSEKAASLFAAKESEAFGNNGSQVVLMVPRRLGRVQENPFSFYNIKANFKVVYIPTIDLFFIPFINKLAFWASYFSFTLFTCVYLLFAAKKEDIIYSNEPVPLVAASFFFSRTFYQLHDFPESKLTFFEWSLGQLKWVLIHNKWKLQRIKELFKIKDEKFLYMPNAVDIPTFDISVSKAEARHKLLLPDDKKIVVYTGHLYGWKGVHTLAEAAQQLPQEYMVLFIGGTEADITSFKKRYSHIAQIRIEGYKPHHEIPLWQKAADVLVLPNTAKEDISKYYTSPMKLFEYMASKRPIVASRIPSIEEIVDDSTAILVPPDEPMSLAEGIKKVFVSQEKAQVLTDKAFERVKNFTWEKRAQSIIDFIQK